MQKTFLAISVLSLVAMAAPASAYDYSGCNYSVVAVGALYFVDDHEASKDSGSVEWVYLEANGVEDLQRGATHTGSVVFEATGFGPWADSCVDHGVEGPDFVLY